MACEFFCYKKRGTLFSRCKQCLNEYRRENRASLNASKRRWDQRNPKKSYQAKRKWYENHKEQVHRRAKEFAKKNPAWKAEHCRKRLLRKRGSGGSHTRLQWHLIKQIQQWRCFYCKARATLTRDHLLPISRGGSDNRSNIVAACQSCNSKKGKMDLLEFVQWILENRGACRLELILFAEKEIANFPLFSSASA